MKYSLRSLMIAVLVLPPLLAGGWFGWKEFWRVEPEEIVVPYSIMPFDDVPPATSEDWTAAIDKYEGRMGTNP